MKKPILITILIGLLVVVGYIVVTKNKPLQKTENVIPITDSISEEVKADLNGDGNQETLRLSYTNSEKEPVVSLIALDKNGKEIGKLPTSMPIQIPMLKSGKVHTPVKKDKNQFVSFDFSVGPHSSETMFFGLFELKTGGMGVLPICLTDNVNGASDCLFWSGEVGELAAKDLDNDGNLEVVETVDEYPKDGQITTATEKIINDEFKDMGQDAVSGMTRIAKREQGGRGNKVVWEVYRFNGNFFEEQTGTNYNKYYTLASQYLKTTYPTYPSIMKRTTMSKESLDYNLFMRKFWTKRS